MADHTSIEWTDATWNPVTGCAVVSPGCTNCYAMRLAGTRLQHHPSRAGLTRPSKAGPVWTGEVRFNEEWLDQPLRWRRPRRIFVCAHGDLFAEGVEDAWIDQVFAVMALCPQHVFQVLTKRPERMREYLKGTPSNIPYLGRMPLERIHLAAAGHMEGDGGFMDALKEHGNIYSLYCSVPWPLPNVWLGVSVEDQTRANERIPILLDTPAAVRWVSAEPLLGPIDFSKFMWPVHGWWRGPHKSYAEAKAAGAECGLKRQALVGAWCTFLDWVVLGGESGPGARPMHPDWARAIRDQCAAAGVPFLFKQWGEYQPEEIGREDPRWISLPPGHVIYHRVGKTAAGRALDGVVHDAWPEARHG
ncbi:DUF5131 family protein [Jiella marina]|uniref:DUF5131 family protein n=1 Tax=Jiella sp. LLJ827 TaxID=2917712 RepID=UPI00210147DE|nr:phage Gp37/Gp68 family protein [Jiella sp. LLJ827]MCQ0986443.1 phage Gp37/Gp68 family protein [Jiella sp. LLJ827]